MPNWNLWVISANMIEPSMVRAVLEAPCSKAVEKVLSTKYPRAEHLDMFRLCRNYLIFRIIACNGKRSGIIPNMTPSSFERARQKKGGIVMTVSRHFISLLHFNKEFRSKFTTYFQIKKQKIDFVGPAVIALPGPLQEFVQNFLYRGMTLLRCLRHPCFWAWGTSHQCRCPSRKAGSTWP